MSSSSTGNGPLVPNWNTLIFVFFGCLSMSIPSFWTSTRISHEGLQSTAFLAWISIVIAVTSPLVQKFVLVSFPNAGKNRLYLKLMRGEVCKPHGFQWDSSMTVSKVEMVWWKGMARDCCSLLAVRKQSEVRTLNKNSPFQIKPPRDPLSLNMPHLQRRDFWVRFLVINHNRAC